MNRFEIIDENAVYSLHGTIFQSCRGNPGREALISSADSKRKYTRGEIVDLAGKIACGLVRSGFEKGQRIGLLAENCPEWGIVYLAILSAGGVVVPLDPALKRMELENLLIHSRISFLFTADNRIDDLAESASDNNLDLTIVGIEDSISGAESYADEDQSFFDEQVDPDDTAALIYTSGTTGDPKGVILTHRNLISNLESIRDVLPLDENAVFLSLLPIHHTFEATVGFLYPMLIGARVVYAKGLSSRDMMEDIRDFEITCMLGVPLLYDKMYKSIRRKVNASPVTKRMMFGSLYGVSKFGWKINRRWGQSLFRSLRDKAGLSSIEYFISGGGPLLPEIPEFFNMLGFTFLEGYGLTECSPVISVNIPEDTRFGSVGPPLPGIEVAIDNPSIDGIGEIIVKGDNNTPGYIDNPEATTALRDEDWLYTGDLGKIEDGHIYIMGRAKNLIVTAAGKNVYPEEIEEFLYQSEYIYEAIVVGRKRENRMGEDVCAIIYPDLEQLIADKKVDSKKPEIEIIRDTLALEIKHVNEHLASFKRISKFDIRLKEFEKTTTRKIKRNLYL